MRSVFEAIGRLVGAVLMLFVLGFVLSFLGCADSGGPWGPSPDAIAPPDSVLADQPLTIPDMPEPPPPPPDLGQ